MSERPVLTLLLDQAMWGPGGHRLAWVAWYAGEEAIPKARRGWGQTEREARDELKRLSQR